MGSSGTLVPNRGARRRPLFALTEPFAASGDSLLGKPDIDPFVIAPYLTAPFPAYVSLWSALSTHGMIEQIPRQVFVCSLGRARTVKTTRATYTIHHLAAEVFGGYAGTKTATNASSQLSSRRHSVAPRTSQTHLARGAP
jgi:hypothetical protein